MYTLNVLRAGGGKLISDLESPIKDINSSVNGFYRQKTSITSVKIIETESEMKIEIAIKPDPPSKERCQCCGRSVSELEPFEDLDEFPLCLNDNPFLIEVTKSMCPDNEEASIAYKEAMQYVDPEKFLQAKYGEQKGTELLCRWEAANQFVRIRLCRDCANLNDDEYFEKLAE